MSVRRSSVLGTDRPVSSVQEYIGMGGGRPWSIAQGSGPERVIDEVKRSGLRGRGGAGFSTGVKWETVRADPNSTKYFICNAAEGEPGTFKDRWLLRLNPYQVLEGIVIAAYAIGARRAFIGIKEGYEPEIEKLKTAMSEMREAEILGDIPIELVTGPDEYLFGEEKAMLEVIEGSDPLPRIFPPYKVGLFAESGSANPTAVNNVETVANIPAIMRAGAGWFRSFGTEGSPGTMVFTLIGDVQVPGIYELPLGTSLEKLIDDVGGGLLDGRKLKAIFPGASHPIIPAHKVDVPLDFDAMKAAGTGLGSGGFVVYDDSTCIVEATLAFSRFLHVESCAQCTPCKTGSQEITTALARIQDGEGTQEDLDNIKSRCASVTGGQLCYLPTGESVIVGSALKAFEEEFKEHLGKACPCPRDLHIPKIVDFDEKRGVFQMDDSYALKQPDWTYADSADNADKAQTPEPVS